MADIEKDIEELRKALRNDTDIAIGIKELFKDTFGLKKDLEQHDVDLRTDLFDHEVSAMSVSNFLGSININGLKKSSRLTDINSKKIDHSLSKGLSVLMFQLKRHKISRSRESRKEIIDVLRGHIERKESGGFFQRLFNPRGDK